MVVLEVSQAPLWCPYCLKPAHAMCHDPLEYGWLCASCAIDAMLGKKLREGENNPD